MDKIDRRGEGVQKSFTRTDPSFSMNIPGPENKISKYDSLKAEFSTA